MAQSFALGGAADGAGLGFGAGGIAHAVAVGLTLGLTALGTGLGLGAGGIVPAVLAHIGGGSVGILRAADRADTIGIAMAVGLAFGGAADRAGLGFGAGSIVPAVLAVSNDFLQLEGVNVHLAAVETVSSEAAVKLQILVVVSVIVCAHIAQVVAVGSLFQLPQAAVSQTVDKGQAAAGGTGSQIHTVAGEAVIVAVGRHSPDSSLIHGAGGQLAVGNGGGDIGLTVGIVDLNRLDGRGGSAADRADTFHIAVSQLAALGGAADVAGLGCSTGGLVPAVRQGLTLGGAADAASLGCGTGGLVPAVGAAGQLIDQNVILPGSIDRKQTGTGVVAQPVAGVVSLRDHRGNTVRADGDAPGGIVGKGCFGPQIVLAAGGGIQIASVHLKREGASLLAFFQMNDLGIVIDRNRVAGLGNGGNTAVVVVLRGAQSLVVILGHDHDPVTGLQIGHIGHKNDAGRFGGAADRADTILKGMGNQSGILRRIAVTAFGVGAGIGGVTQSGAGGIGHHTGTVATGVAVGSHTVRRRGNARGNSLTEQQVGQLGVVNKDVAGAGDGLHRIVAAQLPGINRIFPDPLEQNILTLDDALCAPHEINIAPAGIHIEHDAGHVAAQVVVAAACAVGIVKTVTLTVGRVAAAGVFTGSSRTQHHDVIFCVAAAFAVGPGVLAVPRRGAAPFRADGDAGIERGNAPAAALAVGVLIHFLCIVI